MKKDFVLHSGKLFQQYACDLFSAVESDRLDFYRANQDKMKSSTKKNARKAVESKTPDEEAKPVILPSTFIGGNKWYVEQYMDAMTRVAKFGSPDLFVTMTCNPKWDEIQQSMSRIQQTHKISAADRPDILARVFHIKMTVLIHELTKKQIFGEVIAHQAVVEYQKRGLPHCHILLWLHPDDKPRTPEDYNRFVSAEIPDYRSHPLLFELVKAHMVHLPCGKDRACPCMVGKKCKAHFPKRYCNKARKTDNSYPKLRRRSPEE